MTVTKTIQFPLNENVVVNKHYPAAGNAVVVPETG